MDSAGFEPAAFRLQTGRSTADLRARARDRRQSASRISDVRGLPPASPAVPARSDARLVPARSAACASIGRYARLRLKGGDPSAGSPTDTLLRLNPPRSPQVRAPQEEAPSLGANSDGLTGGVCKEQGHIHRDILSRDYYGIHFHEGELQPSIQTTGGFRDYLPLSGSTPIVPSFVARV